MATSFYWILSSPGLNNSNLKACENKITNIACRGIARLDDIYCGTAVVLIMFF